MVDNVEPSTPQSRGEITTIIEGRTAAGAMFSGLEDAPAANAFLFPQLMSAHEETAIGRLDAVTQARQVERQSEVIRGGINRKTNTLVGADLRPQSKPDWRSLGQTAEWADDFARQAEALFKSWANDRRKIADAEGHNTFGGLMWLACRNVSGPDGESFGVIHYDAARARRLNTKWATTVSVLDPGRVETPPEHTGEDRVVDGKLLDEYGRMLGFYVNRRPRGIDISGDMSFQFVPRETRQGRPMGWHYFNKHRGAAQRGITSLINTLKRARMLDKFDSAQLGAAVVAAAMATYVESSQESEAVRENLAPPTSGLADPFGTGRLAFYDKMKLRIGPQRIPVLPIGDKIIISAADRGASDPSSFRKGFLREFASALGMTAEQLSLDYSDVNYSSARAAMVDIWRGVLTERAFFASSAPSLIFDAVLEEAIVKGWLTLPANGPGFYEAREAYTRCDWTGPAMGWVDPKKEAEAAILRVDPSSPLSTLTEEAAAQGRSFEETVETRTREQRLLVSAGLIPSIMAQPKVSQPAAPDQSDPPERREEE